jgi:hypothetical protein
LGKKQNIKKYLNLLKMFVKCLNTPDTTLAAGEEKYVRYFLFSRHSLVEAQIANLLHKNTT